MPRKTMMPTMRSVMRAQPQAMIVASIQGRRPEPVRSRCAGKETELDQKPDDADQRDQHDQHPPAGFVAVVPPLDIDENGGDDDHERKDAAEQSNSVLGVVSPKRQVEQDQNDADDGARQHQPKPELLAVHAALGRKVELLPIEV